MRGKFRTKLKYGIFPAEKSPRGIPPPPPPCNALPSHEFMAAAKKHKYCEKPLWNAGQL